MGCRRVVVLRWALGIRLVLGNIFCSLVGLALVEHLSCFWSVVMASLRTLHRFCLVGGASLRILRYR